MLEGIKKAAGLDYTRFSEKKFVNRLESKAVERFFESLEMDPKNLTKTALMKMNSETIRKGLLGVKEMGYRVGELSEEFEEVIGKFFTKKNKNLLGLEASKAKKTLFDVVDFIVKTHIRSAYLSGYKEGCERYMYMYEIAKQIEGEEGKDFLNENFPHSDVEKIESKLEKHDNEYLKKASEALLENLSNASLLAGNNNKVTSRGGFG